MCVSRLRRYKEHTNGRDNIRGLALKARRADIRRMLVHPRGDKNAFLVYVSMLSSAT
jgi:hypothetical protein